MTTDTVVVIKGAFTDAEITRISGVAREINTQCDVATGSIVELGIDCGEGRTMRVRMVHFFDWARHGLINHLPVGSSDIHSPGVRLE